MKTYILLPIVALLLIPLQAALPEGPDVIKPNVQWKYGYRDGRINNTLGSARDQSSVPNAAPAISSGYSPAQISHAYGFDQIPAPDASVGTTIAIVVAYGSPRLQSDLNTFCAKYNLPATTVRVYYPSGTPGTNNSGWAAETTLDTEWSHALSPNSTIAVVVAPNASVGSLTTAVNYASQTLKATVVSMSWGAPEFKGCAVYDSLFQPPTLYTASSGDNGAGVEWPACSPNVLGVGGTSLVISTSTGSISSETAWTGSGGGISQYEARPAYQSSVTNTTGRSGPDISYVADPYTGVSVYFTDPSTGSGGWYVFGGTSAGAPQWAALLARKSSSTTSFSSLLYSNAVANYSAILRDITSGSNGKYFATIGYDTVTGLGSPVAQQIAELNSAPTPPSPTPTPTPQPVSGTLHSNQLYAAWLLIQDLNQSFTKDKMARNPGGGAFLSDGSKMINYQAAQAEMAAGIPITAVFYASTTTSASLPANSITWQTLKNLSYSQSGKLQTPSGIFPLYLINLN